MPWRALIPGGEQREAPVYQPAAWYNITGYVFLCLGTFCSLFLSFEWFQATFQSEFLTTDYDYFPSRLKVTAHFRGVAASDSFDQEWSYRDLPCDGAKCGTRDALQTAMGAAYATTLVTPVWMISLLVSFSFIVCRCGGEQCCNCCASLLKLHRTVYAFLAVLTFYHFLCFCIFAWELPSNDKLHGEQGLVLDTLEEKDGVMVQDYGTTAKDRGSYGVGFYFATCGVFLSHVFILALWAPPVFGERKELQPVQMQHALPVAYPGVQMGGMPQPPHYAQPAVGQPVVGQPVVGQPAPVGPMPAVATAVPVPMQQGQPPPAFQQRPDAVSADQVGVTGVRS